MPEETLEPLALEFNVSDNPDGKIGKWDINPINRLKRFYVEKFEKFEKRVEIDFLGYSKIIIRKRQQEGGVTEVTLSDKLKELCDNKPNDYLRKETELSNGEVTHLTFKNAMKCLQQEYNFSRKNAQLTLAAFVQGGFGAGNIFQPSALRGSRLIVDIDQKNNVTLKTSASEFNYADEEESIERRNNDFLKGLCPSKNDIFVNASIYIGRVDNKKPSKPKIEATLASSGKDGIASIKKLQQEWAGRKLLTAEKDFEGEKNLCLSRLVKFIDPDSLSHEWNQRIEQVIQRHDQHLAEIKKSSRDESDTGAQGATNDHVMHLAAITHLFKEETVPIIARMIALKDHRSLTEEEEISQRIIRDIPETISSKATTANAQSIFTKIRKALSGKSINSAEPPKTGVTTRNNEIIRQ